MKHRFMGVILAIAMMTAPGCESVVEVPYRIGEKAVGGVNDGGNYLIQKSMHATGLKPEPQEIALGTPIRSYGPEAIFGQKTLVEDPELLDKILFLTNQSFPVKNLEELWQMKIGMAFAADQRGNSDGLADKAELAELLNELSSAEAEKYAARAAAAIEKSKATGSSPASGATPPSRPVEQAEWLPPGGATKRK